MLCEFGLSSCATLRSFPHLVRLYVLHIPSMVTLLKTNSRIALFLSALHEHLLAPTSPLRRARRQTSQRGWEGQAPRHPGWAAVRKRWGGDDEDPLYVATSIHRDARGLIAVAVVDVYPTHSQWLSWVTRFEECMCVNVLGHRLVGAETSAVVLTPPAPRTDPHTCPSPSNAYYQRLQTRCWLCP